jgi:ribosomal protein S20
LNIGAGIISKTGSSAIKGADDVVTATITKVGKETAEEAIEAGVKKGASKTIQQTSKEIDDIVKQGIGHSTARERFTKIGISDELLISHTNSITKKYTSNLQEGMNNILTKINGQDVTIRINVHKGNIRSITSQPAFSNRANLQNVIRDF